MDMKRYIDSRTIAYTILFLSGVVILCIGASNGFHAYVNTVLTIGGGILTVAGSIYLTDKLISLLVEKRVSPKWKVYNEIAGFLKWAMLEIIIGMFAIGYWVIALYIVKAASSSH